MLGFVGTIVGIINIFYKISLDSNINISSISDGLYQKMITSGAGLIVGLIAFVGYQLLEARVERFIEHIEDNKLQVKELLNQPGL
jgi:biopolymer transport protein ExbB